MDVPNIATDVGQLAHLQAVHTAACMHGLVLYICSHYDGAGLGFGIEHTVAYFYLLLFYCAVSTERSVLLRAHKCVLVCLCGWVRVWCAVPCASAWGVPYGRLRVFSV
jgi:hypothetical protein